MTVKILSEWNKKAKLLLWKRATFCQRRRQLHNCHSARKVRLRLIRAPTPSKVIEVKRGTAMPPQRPETLALGLEHTDDIIADVSQALDAAA
jgi:hypothetical protein